MSLNRDKNTPTNKEINIINTAKDLLDVISSKKEAKYVREIIEHYITIGRGKNFTQNGLKQLHKYKKVINDNLNKGKKNGQAKQ